MVSEETMRFANAFTMGLSVATIIFNAATCGQSPGMSRDDCRRQCVWEYQPQLDRCEQKLAAAATPGAVAP